MALYIHPENQKLLWTAFHTSPLVNGEQEDAQLFQSVIQQMYETMKHNSQELTPQQLRDINMDTILQMIRRVKQRVVPPETNRLHRSVELDTMVVANDSLDAYHPPPPQNIGGDNEAKWGSLTFGSTFRNDVEESLGEIVPFSRLTGENTMNAMHHGAFDGKGAEYLHPRQGGCGGGGAMVEHHHRSYSLEIPSHRHVAMHDGREHHYPNQVGHSLDPFQTPILTKCLNIDTRFRDDFHKTSSSDFTFNLPMDLKRVVSMQLTAYELPITFYGISDSYGNNFFYITCTYKITPQDDTMETKTLKIVMPDGNYSVTDMVAVMNDQLRPLNSDGALSNNDDTTPDNKVVFNFIQFQFDITESGSGSGKMVLFVEELPSKLRPEKISVLK